MASAKGQRQAAMYGIGELTRAQQENEDWLRQNQIDTRNELDAQTNSGLDALYRGVNLAKDQVNGSMAGFLDNLQKGYLKASDQVGSGFDQGREDYLAGIARLDPYITAGNDATRVYRGSLGLGGADERAAAESAFTTSPGFQKRQDLATDAVARASSALGTLGGGNTIQGVTDRAFDLGTAEYGGWQDRLQALGQQGLGAATTAANFNGAMGNLVAQKGQALGGLSTQYFGNVAQGMRDNANSLANLELTAGQGTLGARQGLGGQIAGVNNSTTSGLVNSNLYTTKAGTDLAYEAGKASDAARTANSMLPFQIVGSIANLAKSVTGFPGLGGK